jgi:hypothetical protein
MEYPRVVPAPRALAEAASKVAKLGADLRVSNGRAEIRDVWTSPDKVVQAIRENVPWRAKDDDLTATLEDLKVALQWTLALRTCPVCAMTTRDWAAQPTATFFARCGACATGWGLDLCRNGHRRPFIRLSSGHGAGADTWSTAPGDACCEIGT